MTLFVLFSSLEMGRIYLEVINQLIMNMYLLKRGIKRVVINLNIWKSL